MTLRSFISIAVTVLALAASANFAHAQATRTWVSGVGDDANPCSRTAPCKTFGGTISKTATGGEINIIDAGAYGTVTINKSLSIIGEGPTAGVLGSGTNGITVILSAGSKVYLEGLDIEGAGTGLNGIRMIGAGKLTINDCSIRNFTGAAIDVAGSAGARVFVNNVTAVGNAYGVRVLGASGAANTAFIDGSLLDNNSSSALEVTGPSTVVLNNSTLSGSGGPDLSVLNNGNAISYGNNLIRNGTPTQTLSLK